MIEQLPLLTPDPRTARARIARCHDRLAARRRKSRRAIAPQALGRVGAERLLVVGVCVAYLIAMAGDLFAIGR